MAAPGEIISTEVEADPRCAWTLWTSDSSREVAQLVAEFEPLDTSAGHDATAWLQGSADRHLYGHASFGLRGPP